MKAFQTWNYLVCSHNDCNLFVSNAIYLLVIDSSLSWSCVISGWVRERKSSMGRGMYIYHAIDPLIALKHGRMLYNARVYAFYTICQCNSIDWSHLQQTPEPVSSHSSNSNSSLLFRRWEQDARTSGRYFRNDFQTQTRLTLLYQERNKFYACSLSSSFSLVNVPIYIMWVSLF